MHKVVIIYWRRSVNKVAGLLVVDDGDGEGHDDACHDEDSNDTQDTIEDDIVKVAGLLFGDDFGR